MMATRIVLRSLGDDAFGAYRVAAEWLAYVALLDFGLGSALYPIFARAASSSDPEEEEKALSTSLRAYLVVLAFMPSVLRAFCSL